MYQQPMPQPRDEYERRNSSYAEPGSSTGYDEGYKANPQYNDQLADAIAQDFATNSRLAYSHLQRPQQVNALLSLSSQ